jgi:hypothetical protein
MLEGLKPAAVSALVGRRVVKQVLGDPQREP